MRMVMAGLDEKVFTMRLVEYCSRLLREVVRGPMPRNIQGEA